MNTKIFSIVLGLLGIVMFVSSARAWDDVPLFHSTDPLASRGEWGVFHQSPVLNSTDFAPRSGSRLYYYLKHRNVLLADEAYVGALQVSLRRWGYYCGPIDGVYTTDVSEAIAHLQKAYAMRVTGTLTVPVRRALYLP